MLFLTNIWSKEYGQSIDLKTRITVEIYLISGAHACDAYTRTSKN